MFCLSNVFKDLLSEGSMQLFIDDLLAYATTLEEYLVILERIFTLCEKFNLKFNVDKTTLGDNHAK